MPPGPSDLTIASRQNERIKAVRRLQRNRERRATGRTLLEGPHLLEAAFDAGVVPEVVFVAEGDAIPRVDTEVVVVTESVLEAIAPSASPRGPIAVIEVPEPAALRAEPTVVLWEVATPGNVGTLIRTAAAFGWNVARHGGADPWSPKVLRAAAGAHFAAPIAEVDDLGELVATGLTPVATVATGGIAPEAVVVDGPIALLIGNEASGLPDTVIDAAPISVTIPMVGGESLNAAAAGSIALYALRERT